MTRILHVITTIDWGGAEKQLLILAKAQMRSGSKVEVFVLKGKLEMLSALEDAGVKVHALSANKHPIRQSLEVLKLVAKERYSVVHAHLPRAELVSLCASALLPRIITRHNSESFLPSNSGKLSKTLSLLSCLCAKRIVFISQATKEFAMSAKEVIGERKFRVVHYGFDFQETNIQISLRKNGNSFKILTIGRLVNQKNISVQIEAIAQMPNLPITLDIVGDGILFSDLQNLVERLGVQNRVKFLGRSPMASDLIRDYDVFLLSSFYEGFGLVLLEAVDQGTAIVCSNISTSIEVLGKEFSYFFDPKDTHELYKLIERLYASRRYEFTYETVKKRFEIEKCNKTLIEMYNEVA